MRFTEIHPVYESANEDRGDTSCARKVGKPQTVWKSFEMVMEVIDALDLYSFLKFKGNAGPHSSKRLLPNDLLTLRGLRKCSLAGSK